MTSDQIAQYGAMGALIGGLVGLLILIIYVVAWWQIFSKAGYSGALSLLFFIPVVNIILFLWFAFANWPVRQEVNRLQSGPPRGPYQG
jgi:hypothetical protein